MPLKTEAFQNFQNAETAKKEIHLQGTLPLEKHSKKELIAIIRALQHDAKDLNQRLLRTDDERNCAQMEHKIVHTQLANQKKIIEAYHIFWQYTLS